MRERDGKRKEEGGRRNELGQILHINLGFLSSKMEIIPVAAFWIVVKLKKFTKGFSIVNNTSTVVI